MTENGNKPAYPLFTNQIDGLTGSTEIVLNNEGLTKRELLAAMAMQGILASDTENQHNNKNVVGWSVEAADALLAELAKEKKE